MCRVCSSARSLLDDVNPAYVFAPRFFRRANGRGLAILCMEDRRLRMGFIRADRHS